ncbi:MAG: dihydroorotate dehydrogenase electron transfer subunit [Candidatus Omnitrophica bacterium]|nr:dihydroorotate dehydrogenase electron transfer subunit [Candidatus Omnitrophota bacterium]
MIKKKIVKITENKNIAGGYFKLSFKDSWLATNSKPGQFLEVRVNDGLKPFLRKPLGIHRIENNSVEVLYEVIGEGTKALSERKREEALDIIGPLGNGFNLTPNTYNLTPLLIAGGIGVAPLVFLAQKLARSKPIVLLGAKTKADVLCEKGLRRLGCDVRIATDDGSKGHKGFVTELLKEILPKTLIYACGPKPMMKEIARIAAMRKIPCQVLLEEYMACGIGACLGCAVMTRKGYKMVCKDGPVFKAGDIIWE